MDQAYLDLITTGRQARAFRAEHEALFDRLHLRGTAIRWAMGGTVRSGVVICSGFGRRLLVAAFESDACQWLMPSRVILPDGRELAEALSNDRA
ncbi:MAG: hypothetical protein ABL308_12865 [Oceanicaulis sp.]